VFITKESCGCGAAVQGSAAFVERWRRQHAHFVPAGAVVPGPDSNAAKKQVGFTARPDVTPAMTKAYR